MQWHRAWAETMRWLEEFELKHIEFIRCIGSFNTMHSIWDTMANAATQPGPAAFARRQATVYCNLRDDAKRWFAQKGEQRFVSSIQDGHGGSATSLVKAVRQFREHELGWLARMAQSGMSLTTYRIPLADTFCFYML